MPDLETRLRAEFDRPDPSPRRSAADLIASTRRIRRRRHALGAAGAAVAVATVVAATYLLVPGGRTGAPMPAATPSTFSRDALLSTLEAQSRWVGTGDSAHFDFLGLPWPCPVPPACPLPPGVPLPPCALGGPTAGTGADPRAGVAAAVGVRPGGVGWVVTVGVIASFWHVWSLRRTVAGGGSAPE